MAINKSSLTGNAATAGNAKPSLPESASEHACRPISIISKHHHQVFQRVCGQFLGVATAVAVLYSFVVAAWRVRRQPQDLAFVAASASLLAALFATLRRAERLSPDSPNLDGERRRLQAAVWALSTALSCAFAYRVAAVMPPAMAGLVWGMTASVALVGLYLLVLCRRDQEQQYQALPDGDSDGKGSAKISSNPPTDELV